jgi:hypothetical protein
VIPAELLDQIVDGFIPVLKELQSANAALRTENDSLASRLLALEQRTVTHGKDGEPGPQGPTGERGQDGAIGPQGPQGESGAAGAVGPQGPEGPAGPPGPSGEKGIDGTAGRDGRDGQPGVPGLVGEKGLDGINGRDGLDGKDGLGFDDVSVDYDGERTFTVKFQQGDRVKTFPFKMPVVLYRGLYDAAKSYETGDSVTWGGSMWIAREDTTVSPDENSPAGKKAWALSTMRGRQGKQGLKGETGERGARGEMGPQGRQGY